MVTVLDKSSGISRRELLRRGSAAGVGALLVISGSAVISPEHAWGMETSALKTRNDGDADPDGARRLSARPGARQILCDRGQGPRHEGRRRSRAQGPDREGDSRPRPEVRRRRLSRSRLGRGPREDPSGDRGDALLPGDPRRPRGRSLQPEGGVADLRLQGGKSSRRAATSRAASTTSSGYDPRGNPVSSTIHHFSTSRPLGGNHGCTL